MRSANVADMHRHRPSTFLVPSNRQRGTFVLTTLLAGCSWISWPVCFGQSPTPVAHSTIDASEGPVFEVATIKPSLSHGTYPLIDTHHRNLMVSNSSVLDLIKWCYRLRADQIENAPSWLSDKKYDIVAEPSLPAQPTPEEDRLMMRKLLSERFHLAFREGSRLTKVYALTLGHEALAIGVTATPDGRFTLQNQPIDETTTSLHFSAATIPDLLYVLMDSIKDRQIVDETGLKGRYDFTLKIPASTMEDNADPADLGIALFKSLQAIGLQLKAQRASVKTIILEHVDQPTPD